MVVDGKWTGKVYVKQGYQPMRPYVEGEDVTNISVANGTTPAVGGMIAYNSNDFDDSWYISEEFFNDNYVEVE